MEGGGGEEHAVGQRWTRSETVILANALKAREEEAHDVAAKSAVGTASDKWETVSKFCRSRGVSRSSAQCNSRWSKGLYLDYKKVRDWQNNEGVESYWKMKEKKRREHRLPGSLDEVVFNVLVSFLDPNLKQTGTPESEVDSDRPLLVASAVEKNATEDHQPAPSSPAGCCAPFIHSVPCGNDKSTAARSQKRKRAYSASPVAAPATFADRLDYADTVNIKPIHLNVPPFLEIPRFGDPHVAERISAPYGDGQPSPGSLEGRLLAQNEAVWNRVRMLNEQVVQMVEMSNQRLLSQMQSLFTQIRLQVQTKVHEATQSIQAELQAALKAHTEQLFSQLQSHGPSSAGPHIDIQVDFSQLPVPPFQPVHMPREKERVVRQKTREQCVAEGLPAPPRTSNRLLPHISDVQKAESLAANKTRLPPHITDVDRILRLQHPIPLPSPLPSWNQASFVISELDRVLGQKPLNVQRIPLAPGPTYLQATGVKREEALVSASPSSMGLNISHFRGPHLGHHFWREVDVSPRHASSEGPLNSTVFALPGVLGNPNQSMETSSGQDVEPSSRHPASSSGTVDGEDTSQDSGQDRGAASSEKLGCNHRERGS